MPVYVVGHISVKDPERWAEYRGKVPGTLAPWGGEVMLRGSRIAVLAGEHRHSDTVVIRFADEASMSGWYNSQAYQALIPLRTRAAEMDLVAVEAPQ
jgi:uncharacterized protein (DUF1330 family)